MDKIYSAQALAYLGDSVIEVWVRTHLVESGLSGSRELNAASLEYVTAPRQAAAMKKILDMNVYEAAVERVQWTFDNFERVYVSFSAISRGFMTEPVRLLSIMAMAVVAQPIWAIVFPD